MPQEKMKARPDNTTKLSVKNVEKMYQPKTGNYFYDGISYPFINLTGQSINRSHISDIVRSEQARESIQAREHRVHKRTKDAREALTRLIEDGGDTHAVYEMFRQRQSPTDNYFQLQAIQKRGQKYYLRPNQRSVGVQSEVLPMVLDVPRHSVVVQSKDLSKMPVSSPLMNDATPMSQTSSKISSIHQRVPISWPPLRKNLRFTSSDADEPPEVLQAQLKALHVDLQHDVLNDRRQRLQLGERVSIPIASPMLTKRFLSERLQASFPSSPSMGPVAGGGTSSSPPPLSSPTAPIQSQSLLSKK